MANFNGTARSNYFRVKDGAAFEAAMAALPDVKVWTKEVDGVLQYAVASEYGDEGTWPSYGYDEEGEDEDIDMPGKIKSHLLDGEVCVLMEAGAEKLRYISGWAVAFDNTDRQEVRVSLNDIYGLAAAAFGVHPTDASY